MFVVLLPARRYFSYLACVTVSLWQAQTSRRHYHNATAEWRSDNYTVQMTYYCYLTTLTEPSRCCLELNDCTRKIRKGLSRSGRGYHQGVVIQSQRTKEIHEKLRLARLFPGRKSNLRISAFDTWMTATGMITSDNTNCNRTRYTCLRPLLLSCSYRIVKKSCYIKNCFIRVQSPLMTF